MPTTSKWGLPYPDSTATPDVPRDIAALANSLDNVAKFTTGTFAARPTAVAAKAGMYYLATDTGVVYLSDGTTWVRIAPANDVPVGSLFDWAAPTAPADTRYVLCDGRLLLRAAYPALYALIGTTYNASGPGGAVDTTTYFRVPDLRGRVAVGADAGAGRVTTATAIGANAGEERVTLTSAQSGVNGSGATTSSGNHNHSISDPGHKHLWSENGFGIEVMNENPVGGAYGHYLRGTGNDIMTTAFTGITIGSNGIHSHGLQALDATSSHDNMPPYLVTNKIIRAA